MGLLILSCFELNPPKLHPPPLLGQKLSSLAYHTAGGTDQKTPALHRAGSQAKVKSESQACQGSIYNDMNFYTGELVLHILCNLFHFPLLVWIIERSQYLNISPNLGLAFAFLQYEESSLRTSWGMWVAECGLFHVWYHHILILSPQSLSVTAGMIIGRNTQDSEFESLGHRLQ